MIITYTKDGMKITHPTGVIQILTITDLRALIDLDKILKAEAEAAVVAHNAHITELQKIVKQ